MVHDEGISTMRTPFRLMNTCILHGTVFIRSVKDVQIRANVVYACRSRVTECCSYENLRCTF